MEHGVLVHTAFDFLSISIAVLGGGIVYRKYFQNSLATTAAGLDGGYFIALSLGSATGAYALGTLNLYISGEMVVGRSILGALLGATLMVEFYKWRRGIRKSTGYIYVIPFCLIVITGRLGCFLSGLQDNTYGTPTSLSWGWDYGDHVLRHPVQLYESLSMLFFGMVVLFLLKQWRGLIISYGFYLCTGFYALQRFIWEFFKPYATISGGMNIFHIACLMIIGYSIFMILRGINDNRTT